MYFSIHCKCGVTPYIPYICGTVCCADVWWSTVVLPHTPQQSQTLDNTTLIMKKILVTGGNKGIGLAIVKLLLRDFSDTFLLLGSRDVGRGQAAVKELLSELGKNVS